MKTTLGGYLLLAAILFVLGACGVVVRRQNFIGVLIAIEVMMMAGFLAFVAVASARGDAVGYVFALFILAVAAAEVAIGLAILVLYYRCCNEISLDQAKRMSG